MVAPGAGSKEAHVLSQEPLGEPGLGLGSGTEGKCTDQGPLRARQLCTRSVKFQPCLEASAKTNQTLLKGLSDPLHIKDRQDVDKLVYLIGFPLEDEIRSNHRTTVSRYSIQEEKETG